MTRAWGRQYTKDFLEARLDPLFEHLSPQLKKTVGEKSGLRALGLRIEWQAGQETQILDERVVPWLGSRIYSRKSQFSRAKQPVWTRWTLDPKGVATAFLITPESLPATSTHLDYRDRTRLRLPFTGTWFVYWGGRTVLENYHASNSQQRFAYDLVIAHDGRTHRGSGHQNTDYFCFGQPVLAPADGRVVAAVDGIEGNRPGLMNERKPFGNHVVLEHEAGEFSFLAHLQKNSVVVAVGEQVHAGQILGRCGNTGRSSEPHLHFHLQNEAGVGKGEGLPAQFHDYLADGVAVDVGEPVRGTVLTVRDND
jgi:murein DD-endopeptidase MepM/ murein hydrolase activator NlpD